MFHIKPFVHTQSIFFRVNGVLSVRVLSLNYYGRNCIHVTRCALGVSAALSPEYIYNYVLFYSVPDPVLYEDEDKGWASA